MLAPFHGYVSKAGIHVRKCYIQSVEKVAERRFFELSRVSPIAHAPGRQNPLSTKTFGFSYLADKTIACSPHSAYFVLGG